MPLNIQELSLILCGPILRRVEKNFVSVFVALKSPKYIQLSIHEGTGLTGDPLYSHGQLGQAMISTLALGRHLHVALVTLDLSGTAGLIPDQLYGYNLHFRDIDDPAAEAIALEQEAIGLINDTPQSIGYGPGELPAFSLAPPDFNRFNLFHGSCRKPHGKGKDMLARLDDLLKNDELYAEAGHRPHLLLLTGDQIYADDVSPPLLRALHDTANQLLGWREVFKGTAFPGGVELYTRAFQSTLEEKNAGLESLVVEAMNNGFTSAALSQTKSLLNEVKEALQALMTQLPLVDSIETTAFWLQYTAVHLHLTDFKTLLDNQINALPADPAQVTTPILMELENYLVAQRALDGYLDFFQDLASDLHWGQIETDGDTESGGDGAIDTDSTEEEKREAARMKLKKQPLVMSRISPPQRAKELKEFAGLTSDAMDAHLIFLGEFYLMYLMSWADVLWPRDESGAISLPYYWESVPNYSWFGPLSKHNLIKIRDEQTLPFGRDLYKVRRVLANIPTLMIFDDHEVTDDWNLNEDWVIRVNDPQASPMGAQLLRNALCAYAVFQDWGNNPKDYYLSDEAGLTPPGRQILNALQIELATDGAVSPPAITQSSTEAENNLFEILQIGNLAFQVIPDGAAASAVDPDNLPVISKKRANTEQMITDRLASRNAKKWYWQYNPYPEGEGFFKLIALDTRTWRGFPDEHWAGRYDLHLKDAFNFTESKVNTRVAPAALIHTRALPRQLTEQLSTDLLNIVISPAPVFGLPLVEDALQRHLVLRESPEVADYEAWQGNPDAFKAFQAALTLQNPRTVVLLSGDVHYAYSNYLEFPDAAEGARLVQLCSSSLRNETAMTEFLGDTGRAGRFVEFFNKAAHISEVQWGKIIPTLEEALTGIVTNFQDLGNVGDWWTETAPILPANPLELKVTDQALIRYYLAYKDYSLFNFNVLAPNGVWEVGKGIGAYLWNDFLWGALDEGTYEKKEEDIEYRVYFLKDHRTEEERRAGLEQINPSLGTDDAYHRNRGHWSEMPEIVGFNNIGKIRFTAQTNFPDKVKALLHQLFWQIHEDGETKDLLSSTQHRIDIDQKPSIWKIFKRQLIVLARKEYAWWCPEGKAKVKETVNGRKNPQAVPVLNKYYQAIGFSPFWITKSSGEEELVWGGAFISYLVKMAGGNHHFIYSFRNIDFLRAAKRNRQQQKLSNPFWLYDITEKEPEAGDIVCNWRNQDFGYQDIDPDQTGDQPAQCEVIVAKENGILTTIGGNMDDSLRMGAITLDATGKIPPGTQADPDQAGEYIALIKIRTDLTTP